MNVSVLKKSRYVGKGDLERPLLLTVRGLQEENVAMAEQAPEMKWCLFFEELDKPLVLNPVNIELISSFLGDETDAWVGHKIVLFNDPSIMFKGKLTGGVRVRAPRNQAAPAAPAPMPARQAAPVTAPARPVNFAAAAPRQAAPAEYTPPPPPEMDAPAPPGEGDDVPF